MECPVGLTGSSLHKVLMDLLLDQGDRRVLLERVRAEGLKSVIAHAVSNDVALHAYQRLEVLEAGILDCVMEEHARRMRLRAELLADALLELAHMARAANVPTAIMKGLGVGLLYPSDWVRLHRDLDVLVPSLAGALEIWPLLLEAQYSVNSVAARFDSYSNVQMSVSFARSGVKPAQIEVWAGSQPTSWWSAGQIGVEFWERAMPKPNMPGLFLPAPQDALRTLVGEVNDRTEIRLRDIFDFFAIGEQISDELWQQTSIALRGELPLAFSHLLDQASCYRGLPWGSKWQLEDRCMTTLPWRLPVNNETELDLKGVKAMRCGKYVEFMPFSERCGSFAIAETEAGIVLRTPNGTFLER